MKRPHSRPAPTTVATTAAGASKTAPTTVVATRVAVVAIRVAVAATKAAVAATTRAAVRNEPLPPSTPRSTKKMYRSRLRKPSPASLRKTKARRKA